MNLLKTSVISIFVTSIKLLSGLVISKTVATVVGPTGIALVGQFQNFLQLVNTLGQGAISVGVIKYTAQLREQTEEFNKFLSTGLKISLFATFIVSIAVAILSKQASVFFLNTPNYQFIFIVLSFTLFFSVINNFVLMVLNGLREIKLWGYISALQSLFMLVLTTVLTIYFSIAGALLSLVLAQSFVFVILIFKIKNHPVFSLKEYIKPFDMNIAKKLWGYSLMAIAGAIALPVSHLIIRKYVSNSLGWEMAGYWQAITYISIIYLNMASIVFRTYYLPKLSETDDMDLLRREIFSGFRVLVPLITLISLIIYLFRDFVITILFTGDFLIVRDLFVWQLAGDVLKVCSLLFAHIMLAKAMIKPFIFAEVFFNALFVLLAVIFIDIYGLIGATFAYFVNYFIYFIFTALITKRYWI